MDKAAFQALFEQVIEEAIQMAEGYFRVRLARKVRIHLFNKAGAAQAVLFDIENAADRLYLDADHFHWAIDVGAAGQHMKQNYTLIKVIPSTVDPVPFKSTLNFQAGKGPFKKMVFLDWKILDEE